MDKKTKRIDARKEHARRQGAKQVVRKRNTPAPAPEPVTEKEIDQDDRDLNEDEQRKIVNNAEENAQHNPGLHDAVEK
ncbi:hypothetical protein [Chryseolinea lacunae]|uniref:Uncharacterized protein n=1 Tax=Chryseolinea lacunae TaxID=2801331 RepID=A0ABS1L095_9BACT|nr:hypothetical protein [Chryseolinea lacunae]MBL0745105.1 hypothetical protein [Chryseolinea lacunae]